MLTDELPAFNGEVTVVVFDQGGGDGTEIGSPDEEVVRRDQLVGQLSCYLGDLVAGREITKLGLEVVEPRYEYRNGGVALPDSIHNRVWR